MTCFFFPLEKSCINKILPNNAITHKFYKKFQNVNLRDNSRIKIPVFPLKVTCLKPCKCNSNLQVYLLSSINRQCLIFIWSNQIIHGPQNVFLSNRGKPRTINPSSCVIYIKTGTVNNYNNKSILEMRYATKNQIDLFILKS